MGVRRNRSIDSRRVWVLQKGTVMTNEERIDMLEERLKATQEENKTLAQLLQAQIDRMQKEKVSDGDIIRVNIESAHDDIRALRTQCSELMQYARDLDERLTYLFRKLLS